MNAHSQEGVKNNHINSFSTVGLSFSKSHLNQKLIERLFLWCNQRKKDL
jgi:hypothetical protein